MPRRDEWTDRQHPRIEPLLPGNGHRGGPWKTVYDRFHRWSADGTLLGLAEALADSALARRRYCSTTLMCCIVVSVCT